MYILAQKSFTSLACCPAGLTSITLYQRQLPSIEFHEITLAVRLRLPCMIFPPSSSCAAVALDFSYFCGSCLQTLLCSRKGDLYSSRVALELPSASHLGLALSVLRYFLSVAHLNAKYSGLFYPTCAAQSTISLSAISSHDINANIIMVHMHMIFATIELHWYFHHVVRDETRAFENKMIAVLVMYSGFELRI